MTKSCWWRHGAEIYDVRRRQTSPDATGIVRYLLLLIERGFPVRLLPAALISLIALTGACSRPAATVPAPAEGYDVIIRGGTVYNGSGAPGRMTDVAITGDRIIRVGDLAGATGRTEIDARGLAVAPGFINMLSWATESLIEDGRGMADLLQGVTLEVFGEGSSMGPLNAAMKKEAVEQMGDIRYSIEWTTLGEYLEHLEKRGVSPNVASYIGATTVRVHELGYTDRAPNAGELARMQALVRQAMEEGALGVGSSLIYAPAFYASTEELIALARAAAPYGGSYISHMRSEGARLVEAVDELMRIAREGGVPAEIYHLKAAGQSNWGKLAAVIAKVDSARAAGLDIRADMYNYTAGATGLDASMPPWVQEGGYNEWAKRLKDPAIRARVAEEMRTPTDKWENFFTAVGSPDKIILVGFRNDSLKPLTGKTLLEVSRMRGKSPEETAMDLVIEDGSRVGTVYFLMTEDNIRRQLAIPWVSFGSDAEAPATEGVFLRSNPHPRAYGNFARLLGRYVRDEKIIPLEEAIRRLTWLPARNLRISSRGALTPGYFADVAIFDPAKIQDHATFEKPHQYATGMVHVFVNGVHVVKDGQHTGAKPGRVVRGPGWKGNRD
jgi:N-acyl-D-amino-acid deacylase